MSRIYLYILIMAVISYLIRVIPFTLIRKPIRSPFIRSFLYYMPYITLSVMTFPAILHVTASPLPGLLALLAGILFAWFDFGLFPVALLTVGIVFFCSFFM